MHASYPLRGEEYLHKLTIANQIEFQLIIGL